MSLLTVITAFTSERINLSPFTKDCREVDALYVIYSIFGLSEVTLQPINETSLMSSQVWTDSIMYRYCSNEREEKN